MRIHNLRAVRCFELFLIGGDPGPINRYLQAAFYNTSELNNAANRMDKPIFLRNLGFDFGLRAAARQPGAR
jgi:hypothetical protein